MKKIIRIILAFSFTCFSFYYTDKIVYLSKMNDPLMIKILDYKKKRDINYENGILTKTSLLVGSSSKEINVNKSYEKMKRLNVFSENLLEYDEVLPAINKENNLDKLLIGKKGNSKNISFVFLIDDLKKLEEISYILNKNKVKATFFIDGKVLENGILNLDTDFEENISFGYYGYNNNYDSISLKYVKGMLNMNGLRVSNYCLYKNDTFLKSCIDNKINTISPIVIDNNLYNYIKYNKKSGYIYAININEYNIKELNSTIIYLNEKGYSLVFLDKLLKE